MSIWFARTAILGAIVAVFALGCAAASPAAPGSVPDEPVSPPQTVPTENQGGPGDSLPTEPANEDDSDGECDFQTNVGNCFATGASTPDVPTSGYADLYFAVREDLVNREGVAPESVKIESIERVTWNDSSLGIAEPGMLYARVMTPGFRLVLGVQGELFTYHTSASLVKFAAPESSAQGGGPIVGATASNSAESQVVEFALEWALVQERIPDHNLLIMRSADGIVISTQNLENIKLPSFDGISLILMTPEDIQQKANENGDFLYLRFDKIKANEKSAFVSLNNVWAVDQASSMGHLSGGGCNLNLIKSLDGWTLTGPMACWIS